MIGIGRIKKVLMNRVNKLALVIVMLIFFSFNISYAQSVTKVDRSPIAFKDQITSLLETADKKNTKDFLESRWGLSIQAESFSEEQWTTIYDLSDYMFSKRISTLPYIYNFAELLEMSLNDPVVMTNVDAMLASLVFVKDINKAKKFKEFMNSLYGTLKNNTFYKTNTLS